MLLKAPNYSPGSLFVGTDPPWLIRGTLIYLSGAGGVDGPEVKLAIPVVMLCLLENFTALLRLLQSPHYSPDRPISIASAISLCATRNISESSFVFTLDEDPLGVIDNLLPSPHSA